jgi:hypothetical protein
MEFCVKVATLHNNDVVRISRALRSVSGVTAVEVDVSSGWVVIRGETLNEAELLARVRDVGLLPERVQHDPAAEPLTPP